jgi:hypothetical protein
MYYAKIRDVIILRIWNLITNMDIRIRNGSYQLEGWTSTDLDLVLVSPVPESVTSSVTRKVLSSSLSL